MLHYIYGNQDVDDELYDIQPVSTDRIDEPGSHGNVVTNNNVLVM